MQPRHLFGVSRSFGPVALVAALAFALVLAIGCGGGKAKGGKGAEVTAPAKNEPALLPAFGGVKLDSGKAWKSSALRGRVLVIDTFDPGVAASKTALARYTSLLNAHAGDPLNVVLLVRDQAHGAAIGADAPKTLAVILDDGGAAAVQLGLKTPGNPIVSDRGGGRMSQGPADDGLDVRVQAALDKPVTLEQPVMPKGFNR